MSNYPDVEDRPKRLEEHVTDLQKKLKEIVRRLRDLEELVDPAVTAQSIRDQRDGLGGGR